MTKPMKKMLIYVAIFFLIVFGFYGAKKLIIWWFMSHYKPPMATVITTDARANDWKPYLSTIGTLVAVNGVDLTTEAAGIVQDVRFQSGQMVKKGDLLMTLRANVEAANLQDSQAKLSLANLNNERTKTLFAKKVVSQAQLDASNADLLQAQAATNAIQAAIDQKTLSAPFDGKLGIRQINLGQYVSPGTVVVTLQALNPLYVTFYIPEDNINDLYVGQKISIVINNQTIDGTLTSINSKIDAASHQVLVEATIPNDKLLFYPGMYGLVNVWLKTDSAMPSVIVPQTAIAYNLSGDYVYVLQHASNKKDKNWYAHLVFVKTGEKRGNEIAISGIHAGDKLVAAGQLKVHDGMPVAIDNIHTL